MAPAKSRGVGHHYAILDKLVDLHEKRLIDDEAFELGMGYFSGQTTPRHSGGTCGKYPHKTYSDKINELLERGVKSIKGGTRKPLNADQLKWLIDNKILISKDDVIKDFLEEVGKRAYKWAEDHPDAARPRTDKQGLIEQGKAFAKNNPRRLAKLAAKFLVIAGPILDQLVGAVGEAAADNSPVRREMLAALAAIENDDLYGAQCHVTGTGKMDGMAGELRVKGLRIAADNLEEAWNNLVQAARSEAMRRAADEPVDGSPSEDDSPPLAPPEERGFTAPHSNEERDAMGFPPRP